MGAQMGNETMRQLAAVGEEKSQLVRPRERHPQTLVAQGRNHNQPDNPACVIIRVLFGFVKPTSANSETSASDCQNQPMS